MKLLDIVKEIQITKPKDLEFEILLFCMNADYNYVEARIALNKIMNSNLDGITGGHNILFQNHQIKPEYKRFIPQIYRYLKTTYPEQWKNLN